MYWYFQQNKCLNIKKTCHIQHIYISMGPCVSGARATVLLINQQIWWFIVFNATFNNISVILWRSVLLVEETEVPRENHRPVESQWQTLSQCFIQDTSLCMGFELTTLVMIGIDCIGSLKSNYHTIRTTTAPQNLIICQLYTLYIVYLHTSRNKYWFEKWIFKIFF